MKKNILDTKSVLYNFFKDFEDQLTENTNVICTNSEINEQENNSTLVLNILNVKDHTLLHASFSDELNFETWLNILYTKKKKFNFSAVYAISSRKFTNSAIELAKKFEIGLHEIEPLRQKIFVVYLHNFPIILTQKLLDYSSYWSSTVSFTNDKFSGCINFKGQLNDNGLVEITNEVYSDCPEKIKVTSEEILKMPLLAKNPKCYAKHLGDCNNISREHLISRSVLEVFNEKELNVVGLPNVPDNILLSTNNIVKKILCENHNNMLSKIDDFGKKFFQIIYSPIDKRVKPFDGPNVIVGREINLWLLKVACGAIESHKGIPNRASVPREWIDILFERKPWPDYYNSYWEVREDDTKEKIGYGVDINWDTITGRSKGITFKSPLLSITLALGNFLGVPGILKPNRFDSIDLHGKVTEITIIW